MTWTGDDHAELFLGSISPGHVLEATPDAMIITDHEGAMVYLNSEAEALLGYARSELLGRPVEDLVPLERRSGHAAQRGAYVMSPRARPMGRSLQIVARRKDGSEFPADIKLSPFRTSAGLFIMAAIRDMSEHMRVEARLRTYAHGLEQLKAQVEQKNAELSRQNHDLEQLAYVSSHDLQEPLRKIVAFGDRLRASSAGTLDERSLDYLERMQSAARRMQELINDLLAYSSLTTRAKPFDVVDLAKVTRDVITDIELAVERTGGTIHVGELGEVRGDATQLRQLIQNLLENALKFHREGVPPVVSIDGRQEGATYVIRVQDNGIGIEPRYVERIFTVFERLHARGRYEGTGIGLAIAKKIAERHGGDITVESTPNVGSTFLATLAIPESAPPRSP